MSGVGRYRSSVCFVAGCKTGSSTDKELRKNRGGKSPLSFNLLRCLIMQYIQLHTRNMYQGRNFYGSSKKQTFSNVMGKHAEWRKIAKKSRRKRIRQAKAKDRDKKLLQEQQDLEKSAQYKKWLKEEEKLQQENEKEETIQAAKREEQWQAIEAKAQIQWQELQKKLVLAREEKMKQNMKIKLEWEKEEQKLKALQAAKEKELQEKLRLQAERENELLDFLERGGDTPEHLKTTMETNPGKKLCPFFQKVSACRFFDVCSRNHVRPGVSRTLLISNFFSDISLETRENEHGSDSNLEFEKEDTYEHYKDFFYDVILELEGCGKIRNFQTCCNHEPHLRGNVYVEYYSTREALASYHKFNGRWYGGKQLNLEFCTINSWKNAICGLFHRNRCPKGNACNFLHVFKNPRNLYSANDDDSSRYSSRIKGTDRRSERSFQDEDGWERISSERKNWRWSESPERIARTDQSATGHRDDETNSPERKKRRRSDKYSRDRRSKRENKMRSRSKSSRNKVSRSGSYREATLSNSTRRRSRSRRRSKSPATPYHRKHRSSSTKSPVSRKST